MLCFTSSDIVFKSKNNGSDNLCKKVTSSRSREPRKNTSYDRSTIEVIVK